MFLAYEHRWRSQRFPGESAASMCWASPGLVTVRIPATFKCRGGQKVFIAPDGTDAWAPTKPRRDETLIRALARAHRWKRLLEEGKFRSAAEVAGAESVTRSFVNRLLRLTLLAPDIQEAILDGRRAAEGTAARGDDPGDAERVGGTAADHSPQVEYACVKLGADRQKRNLVANRCHLPLSVHCAGEAKPTG
jgi:hypothetical protein